MVEQGGPRKGNSVIRWEARNQVFSRSERIRRTLGVPTLVSDHTRERVCRKEKVYPGIVIRSNIKIKHMLKGSLFTVGDSSVSSAAQSCPILCEPMDCSRPGLPVHHQLLELTQTHVH